MAAPPALLGSLPPTLAARWIQANLTVAVIVGACSLLQYMVAMAVGGRDPQASPVVALVVYTMAIIFSAIVGAANAIVVGSVIQRVVPALPVRAWITLQVAMSVAMGLLGEMAASSGTPRTSFEFQILASGLIFGGASGLMQASLEGLILRRVAYGVGAWIGWSAAGSAIAGLVWACGWWLWQPPTGLQSELVNQVYAVAGAAAASVVTLLALSRLAPRQRT